MIDNLNVKLEPSHYSNRVLDNEQIEKVQYLLDYIDNMNNYFIYHNKNLTGCQMEFINDLKTLIEWIDEDYYLPF